MGLPRRQVNRLLLAALHALDWRLFVNNTELCQWFSHLYQTVHSATLDDRQRANCVLILNHIRIDNVSRHRPSPREVTPIGQSPRSDMFIRLASDGLKVDFSSRCLLRPPAPWNPVHDPVISSYAKNSGVAPLQDLNGTSVGQYMTTGTDKMPVIISQQGGEQYKYWRPPL